MPYLERDWPHSMADWNAGRMARHDAHAARFVAAGWRHDTASIVAHDLVLEEDLSAKAATPDGTTPLERAKAAARKLRTARKGATL